ncbi:unnamed protein product [Didymodactylos carnosus]|uniref:MULE transposase domain-containing protein n=1 Tax=Didymodactylos carnosus TaxID=1234261 RepID=A0A814YXV7_9BILA|nr:unnamed protein product [Didymodactylos carnosus]CAF1469413.1 unnamed protein product [Didymodactylos carnosus]CAF3997890.1 unnamed protein product [Didymodactylos carnosus]CAF4261512.1 unnamed protein product [Didymodactylos carnosus]
MKLLINKLKMSKLLGQNNIKDIDELSSYINECFANNSRTADYSNIDTEKEGKEESDDEEVAICSNEKSKDFEFILFGIQIGLQKIKKDLLKPSALVSDAADSIKNGFKNVFKYNHNQIVCWSHMKRNVQNPLNIVNNWSIERDPSSINVKPFSVELPICLNLWTSAYQWAKTTKDVICLQNDVSKQYYIPACNLEFISQADLNKYINKK